MKQGTVDLLNSERGAFCVAILVLGTVLVAMRILTGADWISLVKWIAITLVISKTATGALETVANNEGV